MIIITYDELKLICCGLTNPFHPTISKQCNNTVFEYIVLQIVSVTKIARSYARHAQCFYRSAERM